MFCMEEKEQVIVFLSWKTISHFDLTHFFVFREWSTFMQKEFLIRCWPPALSPSTTVSVFPCCLPVEHLQGKLAPSCHGVIAISSFSIHQLIAWYKQVLMLYYEFISTTCSSLESGDLIYLPPEEMRTVCAHEGRLFRPKPRPRDFATNVFSFGYVATSRCLDQVGYSLMINTRVIELRAFEATSIWKTYFYIALFHWSLLHIIPTEH